MVVSEWAHTHRHPLVWIDLDTVDNEPVGFWCYVVGLLNLLYPNTFESPLMLLRSQRQTPDLSAVLSTLIDEMATVTSPSALVLDDYHRIDSPAIHESLSILLHQLPPMWHLFIASRTEPPLSLTRLRLADDLVEVDDLRFSQTETGAFLRDVMGLAVSEEETALLHQRSEGWIAGIQLAALSMQRTVPDGRYIFEYLAEEVMDQQPEAIRQFLLRTAILDPFTPALCNAVTLQQDSQSRLAEIEAANLFLVRLDTEMYRYHHLFAEFLRSRIEPELLPELHRRASDWYESQNNMRAVVRHRLAIGDFAYAAAVVDRIAMEMLLASEYTVLAGWLKSLPEDLFTQYPRLYVVHALVLSGLGDPDAASNRLDRVSGLPGEVYTVRSGIASLREEPKQVIHHAMEAMEHLPEDDVTMRAINMVTIAAYSGDDTALRLLQDALKLTEGPDHRLMRITVMGNLSLHYQRHGQLDQAVTISQSALEVAAEWEAQSGRPLVSMYYIHTGLASALYRRDELESAEHHAHEGLRLSHLSGDAHLQLRNYAVLAQIQWAAGDHAAATATLDEAERFHRRTRLPAQGTLAALRVRFALSQGEPARYDDTGGTRQEQVAQAWSLIVAGQIDAALALIDTMPSGVESLTLKAIARKDHDTLAEAVAYGYPVGDVWGIAQFGVWVRPILADLLHAQRRGQYRDIGDLSYTARIARHVVGETPPDPMAALFKPLTARELEVLRMMARGMTNPEIARALNISPHTVGNHARNIFDKLNVSNRTQAVSQAHALELI